MVDPMVRVLVRRPDCSFQVSDPGEWNYSQIPDLQAALSEHDGLVQALESAGVEVLFHDLPLPGDADSIFVFDPALMTDWGAIILRMGKDLRRGEEQAMRSVLSSLQVPVIGQLKDPATAEGGDLLWLDRKTLAVGRGFRTNDAGITQLRAILEPRGIEILSFDLPYLEGPKACLHLLSLISLVREDLAVAYLPLLPVRLWQELVRRGVATIEVDRKEFSTLGPNVLALSPGRCVILDRNRDTIRRLKECGCEVTAYAGNELSLKAEGGPTCLTLPFLRRP